MTREILFRGKRKDTNEWAHGFLWIEVPYVPFVGSPNKYFIRVQENHDWNLTSQQDFQIHKKSIGQFTGIYNQGLRNKDHKGQRLFEGDIIKVWSAGSCGTFEVKFRQEASPCWLLYPAFQNGEFWGLHGNKNEKGLYEDDFELIGNIFDNPELIK